MKVYLLSNYNEYGSENMVGTTDKSQVVELAQENFNYLTNDNIELLKILLENDESSKIPKDLGVGWGGTSVPF